MKIIVWYHQNGKEEDPINRGWLVLAFSCMASRNKFACNGFMENINFSTTATLITQPRVKEFPSWNNKTVALHQLLNYKIQITCVEITKVTAIFTNWYSVFNILFVIRSCKNEGQPKLHNIIMLPLHQTQEK